MIPRSSSSSSNSKVLVIFTLVFVQVQTNQSYDAKVNELCNLTTDQLITFYGYRAEVHTVTTQDGYILTVFRCNSKRNSTRERKPVIIQHGLFSSSDEFCQNIPKHSLAYILADAGYDVFLLNSRGTTYSRNHISKNPDNSSSGFWQFTWFEIGVYDNAAVVDYVLEKTNTDKVYFIGMSQGSTTILVLLSERPEYNDKIVAASLLVPIGYMKRLHESMKHLDFLMPLLQAYENREILSRNPSKSKMAFEICATDIMICNNFLNFLLGPSKNHWNFTMFPLYACHGPSGASSNQFLHYAQGIQFGTFGRYVTNGSRKPTDFPLSRITAPVSIHFSAFDRLISGQDIKELTSKMKNVIYVQYITETTFNHIDFIWDTRVYSIVYSKILQLFKNYQ